jgi:16S rRNA (guanine527-N7)-methyltransferase
VDFDLLIAEASRLGFNLNATQLEQMALHYQELIAWNERVNLTAITAPNDAQIRHFADSLTVAAALRDVGAAIEGRLLDVGSGGGFPGLPLKVLWPNLQLTMLDSIGKKTAFLQHMATLYRERFAMKGLNVLTVRAEDAARDSHQREQYTIVVARGVAPLAVLAEYCLPFVKRGGWLGAPKKGEGLADEVAAARNAVQQLGRGEISVAHFTLPIIGPNDEPGDVREERQVVLIHKQSTTPPQYPRPVGTPAKQPLR